MQYLQTFANIFLGTVATIAAAAAIYFLIQGHDTYESGGGL